MVLIAMLVVATATMSWVLIPPAASAQGVQPDRLADAARPGLAVGGVLHGYDGDWSQGDYLGIARDEFSAITGTIYKGWNGWDDFGQGIDTSGWENIAGWGARNGKLVHGHALVYPLSTAASPWYTRDANIDHEALMRQYVTTVAQSTAGDVWVWDVVNEVMADPGDTRRDGWGLRNDWIEYEKIGPDYVDKAFRWAEAADPDALLIINDYGAEELNEKSNNLFAYVNELRRRGVPIDGVGFQMHWQGHLSEPNYPSIRANMARFADAGFRIFFTELDVMAKDAPDDSVPPTRFELEIQRSIYEEIARIATEQPAVDALLMWDYADDRSWLHPTIFDLGAVAINRYTWPAPWTNGNPGERIDRKPAHGGLIEGLAARTAPDFGAGQWRLTSNWESQTSYLRVGADEVIVGAADPNGAGDWTIEAAGSGFHRLRVGDQYLTRQGEPDGGGGYRPTGELELQSLNTGWSSQLWRFEGEGDAWRIVNGWSTGTGLLTRAGVPDGVGGWLPGNTSSLNEQNEWSSQRWTLESVGGGGDSSVDVLSSCLAENGRIDIDIANDTGAAQTYEMRIGALAPRFITIASGADGGTTATGRRDGPLPVRVLVSGAEIHAEIVTVACDPLLPEVNIEVSCLAGNGRIDTWLTNPLSTTVTYSVQVGYLGDRMRTAAPGETVRVTVTGRQDRDWYITVLRSGFTHYQEAVTVNCDP